MNILQNTKNTKELNKSMQKSRDYMKFLGFNILKALNL